MLCILGSQISGSMIHWFPLHTRVKLGLKPVVPCQQQNVRLVNKQTAVVRSCLTHRKYRYLRRTQDAGIVRPSTEETSSKKQTPNLINRTPGNLPCVFSKMEPNSYREKAWFLIFEKTQRGYTQGTYSTYEQWQEPLSGSVSSQANLRVRCTALGSSK
jgi:hypothetical protein